MLTQKRAQCIVVSVHDSRRTAELSKEKTEKRRVKVITGHTISLILRLHVHERVKVDIAMEVDVGLDAPVPAVLLEELVFEEELLVYTISGQHVCVTLER